MNALSRLCGVRPPGLPRGPDRPLVVGVVNNAPAAAFRATERRFARALREAAPGPVTVHTYVLPELHPDPAACSQERHAHLSLQTLRSVPPDALVITGAEPRACMLRQEVYWQSLTQVIDWARARRMPLLLSCLAAHAGALHLGGVPRRRLARKCIGVFPLLHHDGQDTQDAGACFHAPHSRWNELRADDLRQAGYRVVTSSAQAGVDMFLDPDDDGVVFLNSHPEYDAATLIEEHCRDVRRTLRGEQDFYPDLPAMALPVALSARLDRIRQHASTGRPDEALSAMVTLREWETPAQSWRGYADFVFGTWLAHVARHVA